MDNLVTDVSSFVVGKHFDLTPPGRTTHPSYHATGQSVRMKDERLVRRPHLIVVVQMTNRTFVVYVNLEGDFSTMSFCRRNVPRDLLFLGFYIRSDL